MSSVVSLQEVGQCFLHSFKHLATDSTRHVLPTVFTVVNVEVIKVESSPSM